MDLSIVIVNYKTKGLLKQCLRGIAEAQLPFSYEVIVVDNDSRDGSVEMVRELFPSVQLIASPTNVGFASGMNLGFRRATGTYVMTLNTDVAVFRTAIEQLRDHLERNPHVGMAVPKLINPDGTTQLSTYLFPSFFVALWRRTPLGNLPGPKRTLQKFLMLDWNHEEIRPIGWALGALLFMRRTALEQVGYFDERYFLFVEDVDLCRRFWEKGWSIEYVPTAELVHYHQRPSAEKSQAGGLLSYPARLHMKSWLKYFHKHRHSPKPPHSL
jgi:GT2 family glycosyltransferase